MKFSIITPTFKRPETLARAIESVLSQAQITWEMIIINDNPEDGTAELVREFSDLRIKYFENTVNSGVNISRNVGLKNLAADSNYAIFLDDDDYLAPQALSAIDSEIHDGTCFWLVTARGTNLDNSLTKTPSGTGKYSYAWSYLISKSISGDATHCINTDLINGKIAALRFPTKIKQADEWLFYFDLGTYSKINYVQIITTLTDGYSHNGLNLRKRPLKEQLNNLFNIHAEARARNLLFNINFWIYFGMRFVRVFIK